jgi:hypothetical protein
MSYQVKETVKCDACSKEVSASEIRHLRLKTCCSYRQVPLCKVCWDEMHKKS